MEIRKFKQELEERKVDNSFKVFVLEDETSSIVANQYIHRIAEINKLVVKKIDSLNDIADDSFIVDDNLYVLDIDKWELEGTHDNCIVICKSTNYKDAMKIPKLTDWQVIDYVLPKVDGLDRSDLEWLISNYSSNFSKFILDIDKISIFDKALQKQLFLDMLEEGCFDDMSSLTVFNLSDALLKKDIQTIKSVLNVRNCIDLTSMHFLVIMVNKFRQIINIQLNPHCTLEESGCKSDKQLWFYRKNMCGYYTMPQLINIYSMLTNIEQMFKYKELDVEDIIDYIIIKVLTEKGEEYERTK